MLFLYQNRKQNRKSIKARISALLIMAQILSMFSILTGCSTDKSEIPELEEPKVVESCYRPVSKRVVGKKEMFFGQVVPKDYPIYSKEGVSLSELCVAVGDYVNAGDVIAKASNGANDEQITSLENEIASLNRQRTNTKNVSEKTLEKLRYEKKIEEYLEDNDGVQEKEKEIATEKENQRYNLAMIDNSISSKRASLSDLQDDSDSTVFTAPRSGYISFVKELSQTNFVNAYENIAVISDLDDLYIEVKEKTIDKYDYADFQCKWTYVNGKKVDIKERTYTNEEISYAKSVSKNPYMEFEVLGEKLIPGTDMVLYFMNSDDTPKLSVGADSVYKENGDDYVYVKSATNTDAEANEKRKVELGAYDGKYYEVVSGLSEGEMVYYINSAVIPKTYETTEVELADYAEKCETEFVSIENPYSEIITADYAGKVTNLHIVGDASSGDALYTLETNIGKADVEDVRSDLEDLDTEREKTRKQYEKDKSDLEEIIKGAEVFKEEDLGTDTDAVRENMYLAERTQCELDILNYNENYSKEEYSANKAITQARYEDLSNALRSGSSEYTVDADKSGTINSIGISSQTRVEKNQYILTQQYRKEESGYTRLHVLVDSKDPSMPNASPKIGSEVTLYNDDNNWSGTCIGLNGDETRNILFTENGKPCSTYSGPFYKSVEHQFVFKLDAEVTKDDLEGAKVKFNGKDMRQVVVVPGTSVKSEYDNLTMQDNYYVWKVENGEIVKEFVTIYDTKVATGTTFILDGVEAGDIILK